MSQLPATAMVIRMAVFQSFWYGEHLPRFAKACISSFLDHGFEYHLYAYRNYDLPSGAKLCDASVILPESEVFYYRNPDGSNRSVAGFANLFRYLLLARNGGWWVDTDVLCLCSDIPEREVFFGREDANLVGTAIMRVPAGHPLIVEAARRAHEAGKDLFWAQTGPLLITELLHQMGLFEHAAPPSVAYPNGPKDYLLATASAGYDRLIATTRGSVFLHLWHEMFRFDQDQSINLPEPGSFLADKFIEYERSPAQSERHNDGK
jgi:hypothetical protein